MFYSAFCISLKYDQVIRQVIATSQEGDTVEVGLYIETLTEDTAVRDPDSLHQLSLTSANEEPSLRCNFVIVHNFTGSGPAFSDAEHGHLLPGNVIYRPQPALDTLILRRLLGHIGATLGVDTASRNGPYSRSYDMTIVLEPGEPAVINPSVTVSSDDMAVLGYPDVRFANEPPLEELLQFAETLRGKNVTLHASSQGSFAHHLSSYLTAWGMNVSHMSTESDTDGEYELVGEASEQSAPPLPVHDVTTSSIAVEATPSTSLGIGRKGTDPAFILIDDDVGVLRSRLRKLKTAQAYPLHLQGRKRPSLASNHRPRSSPQVARALNLLSATSNPSATPSVVIVHFTSLSQFKLVKNVIQTIFNPLQGTSLRIPEVIVIPKPAGPRRFLTALHTAVTRPIVDPFFVPTATSPISPGLHAVSPLFSLAGASRSPSARSFASNRTNSDRSTRSPKDFIGDAMVVHAPASPLGQSDKMEYFSDAALKLGSSPATGLLIQSPDGQPTGIFFHPKARTGPAPPSPDMERQRAQDGREVDMQYRSYARVPSGGNDGELKASRYAITPPLAKANTRPSLASSDPTDIVTASVQGKDRLWSSNEDAPLLNLDQESVASGNISADPAQQQGSSRLNVRRQSQQPKGLTNITPSSPSMQSTARSGGTRRMLRRPVAESYASAPAVVHKKGKPGHDGDIVPPISVLIVDGTSRALMVCIG